MGIDGTMEEEANDLAFSATTVDALVTLLVIFSPWWWCPQSQKINGSESSGGSSGSNKLYSPRCNESRIFMLHDGSKEMWYGDCGKWVTYFRVNHQGGATPAESGRNTAIHEPMGADVTGASNTPTNIGAVYANSSVHIIAATVNGNVNAGAIPSLRLIQSTSKVVPKKMYLSYSFFGTNQHT